MEFQYSTLLRWLLATVAIVVLCFAVPILAPVAIVLLFVLGLSFMRKQDDDQTRRVLGTLLISASGTLVIIFGILIIGASQNRSELVMIESTPFLFLEATSELNQ